MRHPRPLAPALLLAILAVTATAPAGAQSAPSWYESAEPTPAPTPTPDPTPMPTPTAMPTATPSPGPSGPTPEPTATPQELEAMPSPSPTPRGAFFTGFSHNAYRPTEAGPYIVNMYVEGAAAGGKPVTIIWAASAGKLSEGQGESVTWTAPAGKRAKPLVVPVSVTVTDGMQTKTGTVTITVNPAGEAEVTKVALPPLVGKPEDFEGCFAAGTPVTLADGTTRPIEAVTAGDRVAAFDEASGLPAEAVVQHVFAHRKHPYAITKLTTEDGQALHATGNHPLYVGNGQWKPVAELQPGDTVYVSGPEGFAPVKVAAIVKDWRTDGVVYNLKTTRHDYVASRFLVHNKCLAAGTRVEAPGGEIPVEALAPGMTVYGMRQGRRVETRVTHVYAKATMAASLPGKRLADGVEVTVNHLVWQRGRFRPAGEGPWADVAIAGTVYDVETEAGNYRVAGMLMTASGERRPPHPRRLAVVGEGL